ncbi:MAG: hypothetical protein ACK4E4_03730 [Rhodocyclaceae bacterium]
MAARSLLAASVMIALAAPYTAFAERPMWVDDAGTLDEGGAKLEGGWSRDGRMRGWDGAAGFAPVEHLELEIDFATARDHATAPTTELRDHGFSLKWVPVQQDEGLSAGLRFAIGWGRSDDQLGTLEKSHGQELRGLLTWGFATGQRLHVNLGLAWEKAVGVRTAMSLWGIGFDQPLGKKLSLTLEEHGVTNSGASRPDKQIGLRWEVVDGVKLSIAGGSGNDRSFAQAGIAWEF